jgi:glutamine cyclotransferase
MPGVPSEVMSNIPRHCIFFFLLGLSSAVAQFSPKAIPLQLLSAHHRPPALDNHVYAIDPGSFTQGLACNQITLSQVNGKLDFQVIRTLQTSSGVQISHF